jgi:MarR family transcriptional regulator, transcriptional regulator for hemolysin
MSSQKHARSNSLIWLLERTLRHLRHSMQTELNASGLKVTVDQWLLLQQIANDPECNQEELANETAKDPASITRSIVLLRKKRLIQRKQDRNDKRMYRLLLTDKGKKTLKIGNLAIENFRKKATKGVSREELNLQRIVLDKLSDNCKPRV